MSDIFREVDEELRQDRASALAKKYGPYVIGFAVAVVLGTLVFQLWKSWDLSQRTDQSDRFAAASRLLAEDQPGAALTAFDELGKPDGGYGTLAAFERARILAEEGRREEALAIWRTLADDGSTGPAYQGVARLFYVMHQVDDGDPEELKAMLQPLMAAGNGFRPMALELTAVLALREGDDAEARQVYAEIADDLTAPPGMRARAAQMLAALGEEPSS